MTVTDFQAAEPIIHRPDFFQVFGHSWINYATGPADQTGRTDALMRAALDIEYNNWRNYGVNGARITGETRALGGWVRVYQYRYPPIGRSAPFAPDGGATGFFYGINDLGIHGGHNQQVREAIANAYRACISRARASRVWEDSDAAHAYSGFTNLASTGDNCSGTSIRQSSTVGHTVTFTIPAGFNGETLVFSWLGRSANAGAVITYTGTALSGHPDNNSTIDLSGISPSALTHTPHVKRIKGLTSANIGQTIIMTVTSLGSSGPIAFYDCAWVESNSPPPIIVVNIARLTAAGYGNSLYTAWTGTESAKDGNVQDTNARVAAVVAEFDNMVKIADADSLINKNAAYTSDGIHPNEIGAGMIVDSFLSAVARLSVPTSSLGKSLSTNGPSPRTAALRRPRPTGFYYTSEFSNAPSAMAMVAQTIYAIPFNVTESRDRYSTIGIEVSTAGTTQSTIRWGIYDDVPWFGYPQQLIGATDLTSGGAFSLANSTGLKTQTFTFPWVPDPGLYWFVVKCDTLGTSQQVRAIVNNQSMFMPNRLATGVGTGQYCGWSLASQGTSALPGTFPTGAAPATSCPMMSLLKSA